MARFKVGDKVRISSYAASTPDIHFATGMMRYRGNTVTIKEVIPKGSVTGAFSNRYAIEEDQNDFLGSGWYWDESWLEPVSVGFTKADLKDGMVVETREPAHVSRYLVLGEHFIQERGTLDFCFYNDDLTRNDRCGTKNDTYDIVKVYKAIAIDLHDIFKDACLELIWERPEEDTHKEMTVEEIEKELGYKIKVVGKE